MATKGQNISDVHKKILRECNLGKRLSEATKRKIGLANRGYKHTEEAKNKISKAHKGKILSIETKERISKGHIGIGHTEETKERLSKSHLGLKQSYETIEKRVEQFRGNKHWNRLGGKSFEPYSPLWTKKLKKTIKKRDNFVCKICGLKGIDNYLVVHHIDYDKKNCSPNNLITLCGSCHSKTNSNREHRKLYFMGGGK